MQIKRRRFLQWCTVLGSMALAPRTQSSAAIFAHDNPESGSSLLRTIPSTGEKIPAIGLGSWLVFAINPENESELAGPEAVIRRFLEQGGGILDSSPMYGVAEEVIGRCLKRIASHAGLIAASKVWTHGNRQGLLQMEKSLDLWGLPKLDLIQVHNLMDWKIHLPTLQAMKNDGDIRYVGVTTSHGRRHDELINIMQHQSLDFVQFTYNIVDREAEQRLLPLAADKGIAVIINRPFQRGGLFEQFERYPLPEWASEFDCHNWAQFFLKFIISHPAVTCAIPATSRTDHLGENMAAAHGKLPDTATRAKMIQYIENL